MLDSARKPQGVRPEFFHHVQRIYDVAQRFRHFFALLIAPDPVNVHMMERNFVLELEPHHHHARDPQVKNFMTGDEDRRRIERF